jgi:hypothetical protein
MVSWEILEFFILFPEENLPLLVTHEKIEKSGTQTNGH